MRSHSCVPLWSVLATLLTGGMLACQPAPSSPGHRAPRREAQPEAFRVSVVHPQPEGFGQALVLPGNLEGYESVKLYAQVTGYLKTITVDIGDEVQSGAELATLRVPEVRASLRRATAEIASARAEFERSKVQLELATVKQERLSGLHARDSGAVAKHDVDVAAVERKAATVGVSAAEASIQRARAERSRLQAMRDFSVIRAPFDGRVLRRYLHPGSLVREGTASGAEPIVELVRVDPLRLVFHIPESLAGYLELGHNAKLSFDAFPNDQMTAKIARMAGALDPTTRSMRAEIDLPNADGRLKPGMFANVSVSMMTLPDALAIPSKAVRGASAARYVLLVRDGKASRTNVIVAADDGRRAIVSKGLTPSDTVIVAGSPLVQEGSDVAVLEPRP
ncbi:MAG: efflux RND transporter periplasmic adaptor subunit [Nannocystaceae bacterium]